MWRSRFIPDGPAYQKRFQYNPFVSGRVAMLQSHLWYLAYLAEVPYRWDLAALPSYDGAYSVRWDGTMIGIAKTTPHRMEAFTVAHALATSPELLALWGDVPVSEDLREAFFGELEDQYPGISWAAAADGLEYLSVPPHGEIVPNHVKAYSRFDDLRDIMETRSDLNLDAEVDKLESDLQTLFSEARRLTPVPTGSPEPVQKPASP
jgi:ABC-type glycerol-3-phosphate transport system substrate-binding protein